jgi:hypothetical protein
MCGTIKEYRAGCRCAECRKANNAMQLAWRTKNLGRDPMTIPHGSYGYTNYGCRCDICRESHRLAIAKHVQENPEIRRSYAKSYAPKKNAQSKAYRAAHPEKAATYMRERMRDDLGFKLKQYCRSRIWWALSGINKSARTQDLIGCTVEHLIRHLEAKFQHGMSWENYGDWHVDHIKPCALFDFLDEASQRECFHYTNLQPLWGIENIRKSDRYQEVA